MKTNYAARFILTTGIAALVVSRASAADSGFSSGALTGDANSGVSTTKTYVAAANIIGGNVVVNGVTFTGSGGDVFGTNWSLSGVPFTFGGGGNHTTTFGGSVIDDLFDGFQYNGNPGVLTMSGLTAGQTYVVTMYDQAWGLGANRTQIVSGSDGGSLLYNQDALEASLLKYTFVATGATTTLSFTPKTPGNTYHFYGLSNEQVFNNTWVPAGGGSWNNAANWSAGVPSGVGSNASFAAQAGPTAVTVDSAITTGHVQFQGGQNYTVSGAAVTLEADAGGMSVLKADAATHTISADVTLNSKLAKFGAGTIALTGSVTGTGKGVKVGSGTLEIASSAASLSSLGNVENDGTLRINNAAAQTLDAIISGAGSFEKAGAGVLEIGGNQTYVGATTISGGTLRLAAATAAPVTNASFETFDPLANGNFGYNPTGTGWAYSSAGIGLNGSPWFGPTNHDGNAGAFIQGDGGSVSQAVNFASSGYYNFNFQGVSRGGGAGPNAILLKVDGVTVKTFDTTEFSDATWANYSAAVQVTAGTHTISFVGSNLLSGDRTTVVDAVNIATGGLLPATTALSMTGGSFDLNGANQTLGSLAGAAGTTITNIGGLTVGGNNAHTTFNGAISGAGGFTKNGTGILSLGGANTYLGATTVNGGSISLTGGTIPATTALVLNGGALDTNGSALTIGSLAGTATGLLNLNGGALDVGGNGTTTAFDGALIIGGALTKQGAGRTELNGTVNYNGPTSITGGTLKTFNANTGTAGVVSIATGAAWDVGIGSNVVPGLTGAGSVMSSGLITTGADGAAQISTGKNYVQKLDFGDNGGATVNGVTFDSVGASGPNHNLTGATALFGGPDSGGYDQLVGDFYYNGNPGTLTLSGLTVGTTYEAMLYTKIGHWSGRPQNATFDEDGAGPASNTLLNTEPGNHGYYAYRFVAQQPSMSINMAPQIGHTFHWFAASLENVGAPQQTLTIGDTGAHVFNGTIAGGMKLVKTNTGSQQLYGASTYAGGTEINGGSIFAHHASAVGTGTVTIGNGANLLPWWNTGTNILANNFTLTGPGSTGSEGKTAIYADGGTGPGGGFREYSLTGTITLAADSDLGGHNVNDLRVLGQITGPGGFNKGGNRVDENNTVVLVNAANDYVGNTGVTKGVLKIAADEVIPHGAGKGGVTVAAGGTFDLGGYSEIINNLSGGGTVTSTASVGLVKYFDEDAETEISSTKTYTHALDFADAGGLINGVAFTAAGLTGPNWDLAGAAPSAGSPATGATGAISGLLTNFYFNGNPATLTLSGLTPGANYEARLYHRQWGGNRTQLFTVNADGASALTVFNEDASATPSFIPFRYTAGASGTATITTNMLGDGTYHWFGATNEIVNIPSLTVGDATSTTFSGNTSGPMAVTKVGTGTLELSGTAAHTHGTNVQAGTLRITGSLTGAGGASVTGGVLAGNGTITGAVSVSAGGTIAPGNSIGTLSTGPLTLSGGAALDLEIGTITGDKILITGAADLSGSITLGLTLTADPTDTTTFTILDGTAPLTGYAGGARLSFGGNDLDEGEIFTATTGLFTQDFQISYAADSGNDVTLLAVPEPGSAMLLFAGLGLLARRRKRS